MSIILQLIKRTFQKQSINMVLVAAPPTKRNVEIKARIGDVEAFEKRVDIAKNLTKTEGEILPQHDTFFNVGNGRLKLRIQVSKCDIHENCQTNI